MTTNAQLSAQMNDLIARWNVREDEFRAWLTGTSTGGPNGDGKYPLTDANGNVYNIASPAKLEDQVEGPAALSLAAQLLAEAARDAAQAAQAAAKTEADRSTTAKNSSVEARDLAQLYRDQAAASNSNAQVARTGAEAAQTAAAASEANALTSETNAKTSEDNAKAAENAAAASAASAATFNPADFIRVTEKAVASGVATLDANGKIVTSQLPGLVLVDTYVVPNEAGQLATGAEQGDVVIRTDLQKSFIHTGGTAGTMADYQELLSPTDAVGSVDGRTGTVTLGDLYAALNHTHGWGEITGKPAAFTPTAHGHTWDEVSGKPTTFAPSAHGHTWGEVSGKPTTFTPSAHVHAIADVAGLHTALDEKAGSGHLHDDRYVRLATDGRFTYGTGIFFGHANQENSDDGLITAGRFAAGLNIVGVQTNPGEGRLVTIWGKVQTSSSQEFLHTGIAYTKSEVDSALAGKAASAHAHSIGDVTGLQGALDGKLALSGGTLTGNLETQHLTAYGQVSSRGFYTGSVDGVGQLNTLPGSATNTGYIEFREANGTRAGYIGYAGNGGGTIQMVAEAAGAFAFNTTPLVGGTPVSLQGHVHAISDVTGLQSALDGKQPAGTYVVRYGDETLRDLYVSRGDNTGVLYFGNGGRYVYSDGSNYYMPSGTLVLNGRDVLAEIDGKAAAAHTHNYIPKNYGSHTHLDTISGSLRLAPLTTGAAGGGGWARTFSVSGAVDSPNAAVFGAYGSGDVPNWAYIGVGANAEYNSASNFRVYADRVTFAGRNILAEIDGKADAGHTHSYLPLSGGSLSGTLYGTYGSFSGGVRVTGSNFFNYSTDKGLSQSGTDLWLSTDTKGYLGYQGSQRLFWDSAGVTVPGALTVTGGLTLNAQLTQQGQRYVSVEPDQTRANQIHIGADSAGGFIQGTWSTGGTGDVRIEWAGSERLRTTSGGVNVGGNLSVSGSRIYRHYDSDIASEWSRPDTGVNQPISAYFHQYGRWHNRIEASQDGFKFKWGHTEASLAPIYANWGYFDGLTANGRNILSDIDARIPYGSTVPTRGGSVGAMGSYVSFQDSGSVERGWVGFGENSNRLRMHNSLGDVDLNAAGTVTIKNRDVLAEVDTAALKIGSSDAAITSGVSYWETNGRTDKNPDSDWWYGLRMSHGDPLSYYSATIATSLFTDDIRFRRIQNGAAQSWRKIWHSGNTAERQKTDFNNQGQGHTAYDFGSVPLEPGVFYANGPAGPSGVTQGYVMNFGLGSEYAFSSYGMQWVMPRAPSYGDLTPRVRYRENGGWTAWQKINAGVADSTPKLTNGTTYPDVQSPNGLRFLDSSGNTKGYVYHDAAAFGLLTYDGNWAIRATGDYVDIYDTTTFHGSFRQASATAPALVKAGFEPWDVGGNSGVTGAPYRWGYQQSGTWTSPNDKGEAYPDLILGYHTGIKMGANLGYGGVRFYADHPDYGVNPSMLFSVGEYDSNVRVTNRLIVGGGTALSHADATLTGGKVTISTAAPSGGVDGDIWLQV